MASGIGRAPFTIVVPAYNEERVIARTLEHLLDAWEDNTRPRIIVACNGCRDRTAEIARGFGQVEVIEIATASKTAAINAGLAQTSDFPVIVVDADIRIGRRSLDMLVVTLLQKGVMAASPSPRFATERASAFLRAYYRVWRAHRYFDRGVGGSGVYGLSEAGVRAIAPLPPITGDDTYVRWFFPLHQQRRLTPDLCESIVEAPRRLSDLLACDVRRQAGNRQLRALLTEPADDEPRLLPKRRSLPTDYVIYYTTKMLGRIRLIHALITNSGSVWRRDLSSREGVD